MATSRIDLPLLPLHLLLLGPFEVRMRDRPLPRLRSRKSQWLLALLALKGGAPVERDWLSSLLWPERLDRQALRNSLSDLRHALGAEAGRLCSPTAHSLALDLTGAVVDVVAFDAAIAREDAASLVEAVSLYRAPLLEGCAEEWALQERERREQAYLLALERLATEARASGEWGRAEGYLRRVVAVDPLRESAQRALMESLAAAGNHAAALRAYQELRQRLREELNIEPAAETQALFRWLQEEPRRASARDYLPSPARTALSRFARESGTTFPGNQRTLGEALDRDGLLAVRNPGRRDCSVRVQSPTGEEPAGSASSMRCWALRVADVMADDGLPGMDGGRRASGNG